MHSFNYEGGTPTNEFILVLPFNLKGRFDLIDKFFSVPFIEGGGMLFNLTIIFLSPAQKKNAAFYKQQSELLTKVLGVTKSKYVYIPDSKLFSKLTEIPSPTRYYGFPVKGVYSPDTLFFLGINPEVALTSEQNTSNLLYSTKAFINAIHTPPPAFKPQVLRNTQFIFTPEDALAALQKYFNEPMLACDIETKSLNHTQTGIETIAFSKSPHEGIAISVDRNLPEFAEIIKSYLRAFFKKYRGKLIWHNGKFDRKIITYSLYNKHPDDSPMYNVSQHEDTIVMLYCCLNSVEKPLYSLKVNAFEFLGDYGLDVKDTTKIEINTLLDYNIHDTCATYWLYEKYLPILKTENQEEIYRETFLPSVNTLIKTELSGIPVCPAATKRFIKLLMDDQESSTTALNNLLTIQNFTVGLRQMLCDAKNLTLKTKQVTIADFDHIEFNPASSKQVTQLLFDYLDLPVINKTAKGSPSTDKDTLEQLMHHVDEGTEAYQIVKSLNGLSKCKSIIATFIPILEEAITENLRNGVGYIYGSFRIPGTITGRLASSDPNLQNMPSTGSIYAKPFKECLSTPHGYVIVAIDFDSLEDRIAAKITQDPNKLGVYREGFDGHSLRAYYYYPDKIPRMEVTPHNINKIAETHPDLRQASKPITFALTYLGTASTLVKNCGLSFDEAERIEASYHSLYEVADEYVEKRIEQAAKDGYITGAFGFKLRAEILKKVLLNDKKTPHKIQKYTRTLGNMLGQSYGLLNSRAANEIFCDVTLDHHDIFPIGQIHDSQYYIVKDDPMVIYELCEALKKAVSWNDLPELQQDTIELSGTPQLSFSSWAALQDVKYKTYDEFRHEYQRIMLEE